MDYKPFAERIEGKLGELSAKVDLILERLEVMESKYNGYSEKTIRLEEGLNDIREKFDNHIKQHKEYSSFWRMAVVALLSSSATVFLTKIFLS